MLRRGGRRPPVGAGDRRPAHPRAGRGQPPGVQPTRSWRVRIRTMHETIDSDGLRLASHFARPPGFARVPGLVLCHGFPTGPRGGPSSASTYPDLAERLARETGWGVLTFNFRGTGTSEGD